MEWLNHLGKWSINMPRETCSLFSWAKSLSVTYQTQGLSGRRDERSCFLAGIEQAKVYTRCGKNRGQQSNKCEVNWHFIFISVFSRSTFDKHKLLRLSSLSTRKAKFVGYLSIEIDQIQSKSIKINDNRTKLLITRNCVIDFYRFPIFIDWLVSTTIKFYRPSELSTCYVLYEANLELVTYCICEFVIREDTSEYI